MSFRAAALAGLALTLAPFATDAQEKVVLRGQVIDAESRQPRQGALVTATLSGREALTDSLGRFALEVIEDYGYDLLVEDMGYVPAGLRVAAADREAPVAILLRPDRAMLAGLADVERALQRRRNRTSVPVVLLRHDELLQSPERTAWDVVRKAVPLARECRGQPENLCRPGGSRERVVPTCIDDRRPPAGASALLGYEPRDLWLVEIHDRGARVRVYSRWFVGEAARERRELPQRPAC